MEELIKFSITIISFGVAIIFGIAMARHKVFLFLNERKGRHATLDGLRGYLALSVFFHHFIITWYWKVDGVWVPPPEVYYQNYGKVGVAIFFMITGFLFISKIIKDGGNTDWLKLYESRVFRIFPLYVFSVLIITIVVIFKSGFILNVDLESLIKQYMRWGVFHGGTINNFEDTKKVIAGVDWTLKYEWLFYISLPILGGILVYFKYIGALLVIALSMLLFIYPIQLGSISTSFFIMFAIGGISAYVSKRILISEGLAKRKSVSIAASIAILSAIFYPYTFSTVHIILITIFFVLIVLGNDMFGILSYKSSVFLGEISYSIYLLHGVVLYLGFSLFDLVDFRITSIQQYLAYMPMVCIFVILVSSLTYIFIEKPGIKFGHKYVFTNRIKNYVIDANKSN